MASTDPALRIRHAAQVLLDQKRISEALASLESLGDDLRSDPAAVALQGCCLARAGRLEEAVGAFEQSLLLKPDQTTVHAEMGQALARLGRAQEAIESFGQVIVRAPRDIPARLNRAALNLDLQQAQAALDDLDNLLAQRPAGPLLATVQDYRCRALGALKRYAEALQAIDAALKIDPVKAQSHFQRGRQLMRLSRPDEARASFERALAINPNYEAARYLLSLAQLRNSEFAQGWKNYEQRWKVDWFHGQSGPLISQALAPRLTLSSEARDLAGKSVLVVAEQGVGDQIMFASILPDLAGVARKVTYVCEPRSVNLMQASFADIATMPPSPSLRIGDFDLVMPLASLGYTFRKASGDFPRRPYLAPRSHVTDAWRDRLGPRSARLRVGISWRGGTENTGGAQRSLALEQLRPLLSRADCEFVSLQYGDVEAELAAFNAGLEQPIRVIPQAEIDDFEQLAGVVSALDAVVSVQTAIVHLAGAMGAPCLAMIPFVAEWRYGVQGDAMPWYSSVRLFRQPTPNDWTTVVKAVSAELDLHTKLQE